MTAARAYSTYAQNNVQIESSEKLIEMLYEGILRFCSQAKRAIENNDIEKKVYWINRAITIFSELIVSLDPDRGGDIAYYLEGLYVQQIKFLNECNINNDTKSLEIVMNVTKELLEAWREEISHEMA